MSRTLALGLVLFGGMGTASAESPNGRGGEALPRDVREAQARQVEVTRQRAADAAQLEMEDRRAAEADHCHRC